MASAIGLWGRTAEFSLSGARLETDVFMKRSITYKLLLAFLIVGLTGTLITAVVVGPGTFDEFERFVTNRDDAYRRSPPAPADRDRLPFYRFAQGTPERAFETRFGRLLLLGTVGAGGLALKILVGE